MHARRISGSSTVECARDSAHLNVDTVGRRCDVLINNAGVMLLVPFGSGQREEARRMVEVNLIGAITAAEVFLDRLRDGGGDLVSISSVAGRTARAGNAAYAATKRGMNGWSEALRQELQPDTRVTVIAPGAVATELTNHTTDPAAKQGADQLYAELAITPDDVAEVIAFAVTRPRRMTLNEILLRPTNPTRLNPGWQQSAERRHRRAEHSQHKQCHQERDDQLPRTLAVAERRVNRRLGRQVMHDSRELAVGTSDEHSVHPLGILVQAQPPLRRVPLQLLHEPVSVVVGRPQSELGRHGALPAD
jgi:NADP-dependent 3-hydroxy acid dehydrogenase YdfG